MNKEKSICFLNSIINQPVFIAEYNHRKESYSIVGYQRLTNIFYKMIKNNIECERYELTKARFKKFKDFTFFIIYFKSLNK